MRIQTLVLFVCIGTLARAQSDRTPNAAELPVIKKIQNAVTPLINSFENNDWQKEGGGTDEEQYLSVQKHPNVPLGVAPFNDWHFTVKPNSPYFNAHIKSLYDKITTLTATYTDDNVKQELEIGKQLKKLTDIYVEIFVNLNSLPYKIQKGSVNDLNVAGTAYAYKETDENKMIGTRIDGINSYALAFGDWNSAVSNKNNDMYDYKFLHAPGTPYIENVVIRISGNDERIHQLLTTLNWNKINDGLTK
jgi:hypothetical protein